MAVATSASPRLSSSANLTAPGKLLLLASLLARDRVISNNGKALLKDLTLRRDPRVLRLLNAFEEGGDQDFVRQVHKLLDRESHRVFKELFKECPLERGKDLSKEERKALGLADDKSYIYGEVDFTNFAKVLRRLQLPAGGVFYDLGSGTGKAVMVARLTQDFERCEGVEILEGLHRAATEVAETFEACVRRSLCSSQAQGLTMHLGSLIDFDWSDGDVVFANSTCFDDALMASIAAAAQRLRPGALLITFTKGLESAAFEVLDRKRFEMSWGPATVFVHRRLTPDGLPSSAQRISLGDAAGAARRCRRANSRGSSSSCASSGSRRRRHSGGNSGASDGSRSGSESEAASSTAGSTPVQQRQRRDSSSVSWRWEAYGDDGTEDGYSSDGSIGMADDGASDANFNSSMGEGAQPAPSPVVAQQHGHAHNGTARAPAVSLTVPPLAARHPFLADDAAIDSPQGAALLRRKVMQARQRRLTEESDIIM